jgi:hypothetical protein
MLVGSSIQVVYETIAHDRITIKGAAIRMRRRRRLRLTSGPSGCRTRDAGTGDEPAASG